MKSKQISIKDITLSYCTAIYLIHWMASELFTGLSRNWGDASAQVFSSMLGSYEDHYKDFLFTHKACCKNTEKLDVPHVSIE